MIRMKIGVQIFALFLLVICGGVGAVEYAGDYCWQVESNSPDEPLALLQLGVLNYGDGHFPVHGKLTGTDQPPVVLQGNAELTPDIAVTLQGSAATEQFTIRQSLTYHLMLDGDLNGSYKLIGFEAPGGGPVELLTDEGILTWVPCP